MASLVALLVLLQSPWWVGVHHVGFKMLQPGEVIEYWTNFSPKKLKTKFKSKLKTTEEFGHTLGIGGKHDYDLIKVIWKF